MRIDGFIWFDSIVDKLEAEHRIHPGEVELFITGQNTGKPKRAKSKVKIYSMLAVEQIVADMCLLFLFIRKRARR